MFAVSRLTESMGMQHNWENVDLILELPHSIHRENVIFSFFALGGAAWELTVATRLLYIKTGSVKATLKEVTFAEAHLWALVVFTQQRVRQSAQRGEKHPVGDAQRQNHIDVGGERGQARA